MSNEGLVGCFKAATSSNGYAECLKNHFFENPIPYVVIACIGLTASLIEIYCFIFKKPRPYRYFKLIVNKISGSEISEYHGGDQGGGQSSKIKNIINDSKIDKFHGGSQKK